MADNNLDLVYDNFNAIIKRLKEADELSTSSLVETTLSKLIIVSAASFFETDIKEAIYSLSPDLKSRSLVEKFLDRNFWNLFDSKFESMNRFLGNFGDEFKVSFQKSIRDDKNLKDSETSFLRLLSLRGEIVHGNFLSYSVDVTYEESYEIYKKSFVYVEHLKNRIVEKT
ncbi:MAG: HEPN domain-containing protein [Candidatus Marsarchaeota archaeon]|jgi:hypothetical protein|nr:HEPN domain-containing protein [Candidatus Marsarchaeota archaeon]